MGALIESLSFRGCGFGRAAASAFEKEDLRERAAFPQRLRAAVHAAMRARDPAAGGFALVDRDGDGDVGDRGAEGGRPPPKGHGAAGGGGGGGFFFCYLLRSLCPRSKGRTYIGFTVNPRCRIR